jgi:hypothetical protein
LIILIIAAAKVGAQDISDVLQKIEKNNLELKAFDKRIARNTAQYRKRALPPDPEFEYAHLTADGVEKTRFGFSQKFRFPFWYIAEAAYGDYYEETLRTQYEALRNEVLLRAKELCINIIYYNKMIEFYTGKTANTDSVASSLSESYEVGDARKLDMMKSKMYASRMSRKLDALRRQRQSLYEELQKLNGGRRIEFSSTEYPQDEIPDGLDDYLEKISKKDKRLDHLWQNYLLKDKENSLGQRSYVPEFSIGWEKELEPEYDFSGWHIGVSIPVFSYWYESEEADAAVDLAYWEYHRYREKILTEYKKSYNELKTIQSLISDYEETDFISEGFRLLEYSYELGEISSSEYFIELNYFNDYVDEYYDLQRRRSLLSAKLTKPWI